MKQTLLTLAILLVWFQGHAQSTTNGRSWSRENPLTIADFKMDIDVPESRPCFAQFSINYTVMGYSIFLKNFNQKVTNTMLPHASWIDKDADAVQEYLDYQQLQFDLAEVHARKLRRSLLVNRKLLFGNPAKIEELNNEIMEQFSTAMAMLEKESDGGQQMEVVRQWQQRTSLQLEDLNDFRFENEGKIRL